MSYDVQIGNEDFNHTWNTSPLFNELIKTENASGIDALAGMTGAEAAEYLETALQRLDQMKIEMGENQLLERYNAKNKWGTVLSSTLFMTKILCACHRHPFDRIEVC